MPTPSPGLNRVPRWRTMISPPVTVWPANTFTPRRLECESRPLREEPRPFLCAIAFLRLGLGGSRLASSRLARRGLLRRCVRGLLRRCVRGLLRRCVRGLLRRCVRGLLLGLRRTPPRRRELDRRHLEPCQLLAVTGPALVAALGFELDHSQLGPAFVADHPRLDLHTTEVGAVDDGRPIHVQ